jgi:hypothetical protein
MGAAISAHYNVAVKRTSELQRGEIITLDFICKIGDSEHEDFASSPGDDALGRGAPNHAKLERERCRCEQRNGAVADEGCAALIFAPVSDPPALVNGDKEAKVARVIASLGLTGRDALSCVVLFFFFFCELTMKL